MNLNRKTEELHNGINKKFSESIVLDAYLFDHVVQVSLQYLMNLHPPKYNIIKTRAIEDIISSADYQANPLNYVHFSAALKEKAYAPLSLPQRLSLLLWCDVKRKYSLRNEDSLYFALNITNPASVQRCIDSVARLTSLPEHISSAVFNKVYAPFMENHKATIALYNEIIQKLKSEIPDYAGMKNLDVLNHHFISGFF